MKIKREKISFLLSLLVFLSAFIIGPFSDSQIRAEGASSGIYFQVTLTPETGKSITTLKSGDTLTASIALIIPQGQTWDGLDFGINVDTSYMTVNTVMTSRNDVTIEKSTSHIGLVITKSSSVSDSGVIATGKLIISNNAPTGTANPFTVNKNKLSVNGKLLTVDETKIDNITIVRPLVSISIGSDATVLKGLTKQLTVTYNPADTTDSKSVIWSGNNDSIATVDSTGLITAKSAGTVVISANCNGKVGKCSITIVDRLLGDVNGDGYVNATDATLVLRSFVGNLILTSEQSAVADVNKDGYINATDATYILRYYVGGYTSFDDLIK
jgi:hypothetical protein